MSITINSTFLNVLFWISALLIIVGSIDPLEGSILILIGSATLAAVSWIAGESHKKWLLFAFIMVVIGILALYWISDLGGFGGTSGLSAWWGLFILPYPLGWLIVVVLSIIRFRNCYLNHQNNNNKEKQ